MMYAYVDKGVVSQLIPEIDPKFPNVPLSKRYNNKFISQLVEANEDVKIGQLYNPETKEFYSPEPSDEVFPEPIIPDEDIPSEEALSFMDEQLAFNIDTDFRLTSLELGIENSNIE